MIWRNVAVMIVVEMGGSGIFCMGWVPVMKNDLTIMT
jgi:hypothetical protein